MKNPSGSNVFIGRLYIDNLARYDGAQLPPGAIDSECWLMGKTIFVFLFSMLLALSSLTFAAAATVRVNIGVASVSSSAGTAGRT